jgi:hypothetical protein
MCLRFGDIQYVTANADCPPGHFAAPDRLAALRQENPTDAFVTDPATGSVLRVSGEHLGDLFELSKRVEETMKTLKLVYNTHSDTLMRLSKKENTPQNPRIYESISTIVEAAFNDLEKKLAEAKAAWVQALNPYEYLVQLYSNTIGEFRTEL